MKLTLKTASKSKDASPYSDDDQHLAVVIQHTQQKHQQLTQYQYHHQQIPDYLPTAYDIELELAQQQLLLRQHEERHRQIHQSYIYELQDKLAMLHFNSVDPRPRHPPLALPSDELLQQQRHQQRLQYQQPPLFFMRYMQSDDNYNNDYSLPPPPLAFRYDTPSYSQSLSYTDASYDSMNSSNNTNNNNNEAGSLISSAYDDYDDVDDDEIPKKGLLKQMFCLPLN